MASPIEELLQAPIVIVNVGLPGFARSLEEQHVDVAQVDWVPPAGGDKELIDLLDELP